MKLVALGAFAPVALAGAVVGGMLAFGTAQVDPGAAPAASHEASFDCRSPRHSWRWACQQAKSAEGYGVTAAAGDGPDTTGSLASGRSTSAKGADGEPIRAADVDPTAKAASAKAVPASEPPKSAKSEAGKLEPAKPVRIVAADPPAAPEAKPDKRKEPAKEAAKDPAEEPTKHPAKEAALPPAPALAPMVDDEAPQAAGAAPMWTATAATATAETKPVAASAPLPVTAPPAAPETAPAKPGVATLPLAAERPTTSLSRSEAAAPAEEPAVRLSRKRAKAAERAASRRAVVSRPAPRPRVARALPGRESASEVGGYRVMSLRTYTLPDGRRIVVEQAPRRDVVRELLAEHRAAFGRRQFASPYGGLYADEW